MRSLSNPTPAAAPGHRVQFYHEEGPLNDAVASFLAEGWAEGESLLLIATPRRRDAVCWRLANRGIDADRAHREGRLTLVDAAETLRSLMRGGSVDEQRFRATVGRLVHRQLNGAGARRLRVYGEMVDLLCQEGRQEAALRLEALWNELLHQRPVALLCAYAMRGFGRGSDAPAFQRVCLEHAHVSPAESYDPAADESTRRREIGRLQQRATALETEVEERRRLEIALRRALAEQRRTEEALRAVKEQAERASAVKSEFLAVVSHELRTPLNAIIGYQDLLALELAGPLNGRQREFVERIHVAAGQLLALVDQMLSLSRADAEPRQPRLEWLDVRTLTAETLALIQPAATAKGLSVRLTTPQSEVRCESDPQMLRQILLNLLSNAVKFTDAGGVEVEVGFGAGAVSIEVSDTGPGVPASARGRIFEPFVQADTSATRRHGGSGLGLPVSRQLARLLGGDVTFEAKAGTGSTFALRLPASCDPLTRA